MSDNPNPGPSTASTARTIVSVRRLTKVFRTSKTAPGMWGAVKGLFHRVTEEKTAVDRMDFDLAEGELVGYIGANGAGKSTTIKMLTGILRPTSGDIEVDGFVPYRDRRRYVKNIGVVFGQRTQMWWDLAPRESFRLLARIYEVPDAEAARRMGELIELLELAEFLDTPVRKLSLGQRMRCDLAAGLLHKPRILFLDEPTIGLDVLGKAKVREFLGELNRRERVTVLLTTHDLEEIERLCRRIVIIDGGRKIFDGDLETLLADHAPGKRVVVDFDQSCGGGDPAGDGAEARFADLLPHAPGAATFRRLSEWRAEFSFDRRRASSAEVIQAVMARAPLKDLHIEEPGIEEVVKTIYAGGTLAPPAA